MRCVPYMCVPKKGLFCLAKGVLIKVGYLSLGLAQVAVVARFLASSYCMRGGWLWAEQYGVSTPEVL